MKIKNVNIFAAVLQASESVTLIDIQINTQSWFTTLLSGGENIFHSFRISTQLTKNNINEVTSTEFIK